MSKKRKRILIYGVLSLTLLISFFLSLFILLQNKFYPGIFVSSTPIALLTPSESEEKVKTVIKQRSQSPLEFQYLPATSSATAESFTINLTEDSFTVNLNQTLTQAFEYGRQRPYLSRVYLNPEITFNKSLEDQLDKIAKDINQEAIDSQITIQEGQIYVSPSQEGMVLDRESLKTALAEYLNTGTLSTTTLPIKKSSPELSYDTALKLKLRLEQIKLSPLKLTFKDQIFELNMEDLLSFIDTQKSQPVLASSHFFGTEVVLKGATIGTTELSDSQVILDQTKVFEFLKTISLQIDQEVQEPLFTFDPNSPNRIREFRPPQEGRKLNTTLAYQRISQSLLNSDQNTVELPVETQKPQNKLVNDLGIYELIGEGVSNFAGSIPNRAYNVGLAAQKVNGTLVSPGQTFSFNQTTGDITAATGFKPAYVIKSGRTVLDDGGGVCQVSTTLFRAILNSGLPIVERTAHAYRVSYYEQGSPAGIDATTFYPSVDLKFKNDTPASILIQTRVEGTTLYVSFYGTKDGRITTVSTPRIISQSPALPELRQDDPTLPKGTVKQVDWAAAGANVVFNRTVVRNGETIINENIRSNYRPWQAVFLVGTKEG